jgi:two-component system chemotaxis sensor kinase CheA
VLAQTDTFDSLRDQILGITSDFRNALRSFESDSGGTGGTGALRRAGRALGEAANCAGIDLLAHSGRVLERIGVLLGAFRLQQPAHLQQLILAARDTVGTVEQLLDWCLGNSDAGRQAQLKAALVRRFPEPCRPLFDAEPEVFEERLRALDVASSQPAQQAAVETTMPLALLDAFAQEAAQRFARSEELLVRLERTPADAEVLSALLREFHTLKGAAAEVRFDDAQAQLHAAESLLASVRDRSAPAEVSAIVDLVLQVIDSVRGVIDHASGAGGSLHTVNPGLVGKITELLENGAKKTAAATESRPAAPAPPLARVPPKARNAASGTDVRPADDGREQLLERLQALDQQVREYSQITSKLQAQLDALRLVPLDEVLRRLVRPARDAARQEGKVVDVEVFSGDLRIDRSLVEALHGILLHLVRNAVTHGIETSSERQACGKRPSGTVRIQARQQNDHLVIRVDDDGAGLDFEAIQIRAEANGWLHPGELATRQELARFIFRRGFSTRRDVTDLAGRGIGLDVVAHDIETLNGAIDVESLEGQGTSIRISLPYFATPPSEKGTVKRGAPEPPELQRGAARLKLVHKKNGTTDKAN